jgi:hypothetical protein
LELLQGSLELLYILLGPVRASIEFELLAVNEHPASIIVSIADDRFCGLIKSKISHSVVTLVTVCDVDFVGFVDFGHIIGFGWFGFTWY